MRTMLAALIVLAQFIPAGAAYAQIEHQKVLVLYATRRDSQLAIVGERELPLVLDIGLARNLDYYSEFIDITRFPDPAYREAFVDFLRLKYQGVRFDLVIAIQDAAVELLNDPKHALFRDTPVVYVLNNRQTLPPPNSTGVIHERDFAGTVRLIRQLQPDVREVFIVNGAGPADRAFEAEVRRQLQPFASGPAFTYLTGLSTEDLEARLSKLPGRSAVFHVLVSEDGAGRRFHPLEYVDKVTAAANAPTYCWVDSALDHGIVGGSLYRQNLVLQTVARLSLRVLGGERPDSIPIVAFNPSVNIVDWRQLRRWDIDEARVPAGTLVEFKAPTIWDRYQTYILAAAAVLVMQTVLIAGLLIQRRRRQRAEEDLRSNQSELLKSYERNRDLGARLLKAQETERSRIAGELHDDICQRMLLLTIELESFRRTHVTDRQAIEALIMAQDVSKSLHDLSHRLHPARLKMIGLATALEGLCTELSRAGVTIRFSHEGVPSTLPVELVLGLFRVVQEALQNAVKYSEANEITVCLRGGLHGLTLTVADDGRGFDIDDGWGKGVGLFTMVERLEALGGTLDVQSNPGAGTRVTATVPAASIGVYAHDVSPADATT